MKRYLIYLLIGSVAETAAATLQTTQGPVLNYALPSADEAIYGLGDNAVSVFPGADGDFDFYTDDFETYAYEKGVYTRKHYHWCDKTKRLSTTK